MLFIYISVNIQMMQQNKQLIIVATGVASLLNIQFSIFASRSKLTPGLHLKKAHKPVRVLKNGFEFHATHT